MYNDFVELDAVIVRKTAKAVLLHPLGKPEQEVWVPKSQISGVGAEGSECCVAVAKWLADKEGLQGDYQ